MYNVENKCWKSEKYDEYLLTWCREPDNQNDPKALYILADVLLEKASKGADSARAVYMMERAATLGDPKAAYAMATLFQYGWAVGRSEKRAMVWYQKAAELGHREAMTILAELKRKKKIKTAVAAAVAASVLLLCLGAALLLPRLIPVIGIKVHQDTKLVQPTTLEDFSVALNELLEQYDDELVISGARGSNRLMLKFEGEGIDLSAFPAAVVLDNGENYLVVQFDSEEEAQRCLDHLRSLSGILFVEEDRYSDGTDVEMTPGDLQVTAIPYDSPHTGFGYYSWGVEYMGMDVLASWIMTKQTDQVTVAVLDTGSEPCAENQHCYLSGTDFVNSANTDGWTDTDGHGTHVAGTIIDCTWGLDVKILPVRVLGPNGSPNSVVVLGLQYALQNDVDVINLSLGGRCSSTDPDESCGSPKDHYIRKAIEQGIVVVQSAGNGDDRGRPINTKTHCGGHMDECIVVGACDFHDKIAYFSNYGDSVDLCAPGVDITSYAPGGGLATMSGTSMATPHISALAAMLKLLMPDKTPAQIEKYITDYCVYMGDKDFYGEGVPWAGYFAGD